MNKLESNAVQEPSFAIAKAFFYAFMAIITIQVVGGVFVLPGYFYPVLNHFMMPFGFFVSFLASIAILLTSTKASTAYLKKELFQKNKSMSILLSIGIWFCFLPIAEYSTTLIPKTGPLEEMYKTLEANFSTLLNYKVAGFIMVCILAPIFEEIIFRGIILKGMLNYKVHPAVAIVVSGIIFGIAHLNPWQFVGAGILGIIFGFIYYRTKSLCIPILLHALNNCLSFGLMLYYGGVEESVFEESHYFIIPGMTIMALLFSYLLIRTTKKINI